MILFLNSRNGLHKATAEYDNKVVKVLAGSVINMETLYPNMPSFVVEKREDRTIVSKSGKVLVDISFNSPTSAAQFVTGRSVNGYIAWRPDNKMSLKQWLEGKR